MLLFKKKTDPLYLALEEHTKRRLQNLPCEEELQKLTFSAAFEAKMQTLFARYRRHKKANRRALVALAACLALAVGVSAIPYPGQTYLEFWNIDQNKTQQVKEYIMEYRQEHPTGKNGKPCPEYNSLIDNTTASSIVGNPVLPQLVGGTQLGVYGKITAKQPGLDYVQYTLRVYHAFVGSVGWSRDLRVFVKGDTSDGVTARLDVGSKVVFLLKESNLAQKSYTPVEYEHGCFLVEKGELYAFSNQNSISAYDGKWVWSLIWDVQRIRKEMGLER